MTKRMFALMLSASLVGLLALSAAAPVRADTKEKDEERLRNSGQVLKEILNIPDDIPQNLIDKADCVIVIPTVLSGLDSLPPQCRRLAS